MADKLLKRPRDPIQLGKLIVDIATGQVEDRVDDGKNPKAIAKGRKGGLIGGKSRAEALSPEQRSAIAKAGAEARWRNMHKTHLSTAFHKFGVLDARLHAPMPPPANAGGVLMTALETPSAIADESIITFVSIESRDDLSAAMAQVAKLPANRDRKLRFSFAQIPGAQQRQQAAMELEAAYKQDIADSQTPD